MAQYFLHYGPQTFELADAKTAVELRSKLMPTSPGSRVIGYLTAKTPDGTVSFTVNPNIAIAISATGIEAGTSPLDA